MAQNNLILDNSNQQLAITNLLAGLNNPNSRSSLIGLPLGTQGDSATATLGVKVVIVGNNSNSSGQNGFQIPVYTEIDFHYDAYFNPTSIVYKNGATTVATLTYTYTTTPTASGASPSKIVQS
jgi:hypothetical protein